MLDVFKKLNFGSLDLFWKSFNGEFHFYIDLYLFVAFFYYIRSVYLFLHAVMPTFKHIFQNRDKYPKNWFYTSVTLLLAEFFSMHLKVIAWPLHLFFNVSEFLIIAVRFILVSASALLCVIMLFFEFIERGIYEARRKLNDKDQIQIG